MASTLIQRLCNPRHDLEVDQEKLSILTLSAIVQEILAGRMPQATIGGWLSADETVDAVKVLTAIATGIFTIDEVERILLLGESEIYSVSVVEIILGLRAAPTAA